MANYRRFFRYDVEIPIYFEEIDVTGFAHQLSRKQLILEKEESRLLDIKHQLGAVLDKMFETDSNALNIFYVLNHRIELMAWLLEKLMVREDPSAMHDYKFRIRENKKLELPPIKDNSKIKTLLEGVNKQVESHLAELMESVQNNIEGKIFLLPRKVQPLFDAKVFVTNLDNLSEQGILPAKTLTLIIEKLNIWEQVFSRLKQECKIISDPENWRTQSINLSAGGFRAMTDKLFPKFSTLNVYMKLGQGILICRGKLVSCKPVSNPENPDFPNALLVEFDFLSLENARKITHFIQKLELKQAMALKLPSLA